MTPVTPVRWHAIAALTAVSAFTQIGQFGIGFMVLPVWLAHQGLDTPRAGLFSAAQWAGMFAGLLVAPRLVERFGAKRTVAIALAATVLAFVSIRALVWPLWIVPGFLIGLGMGLRWIANETWLYRMVPAHASGRVVGLHEALIAIAGVAGPALAAWYGVDGPLVFMAGAAFTLVAAVPLWLAGSDAADNATADVHQDQIVRPVAAHETMEAADATQFRKRSAQYAAGEPAKLIDPLVALGMVVVVVGGLGDGALFGLFPLFADGRGLSVTQTATLLTWFGVGGMVLQFPVGWLADRAGLATAVIVCAAVSALAIVSFALAAPASWLLGASALVLGGLNSAFLTLGVYAAACSDKSALIRNMRLISLTFCASSIAGPLIAGFAMKALGNDMLIWQLALASGALAVYTLGLLEGQRQPRGASSAS
ncbi:MFS transporter [Paraburkholderia phenazinium]|jgi:MFS family permease|uniref:Predicted arabinose efflux permease, MFS family n=1 Tax=Paraburkholderia phenazinium TaxID=60549 RepID=A0A1G7TX32_9BURK|nr:MFS transporter [Paraburkholderia phenazinium]SDG39788.1 Predicted arabinose efflux permease, MFS family [Paraburkholderia phenazinium]